MYGPSINTASQNLTNTIPPANNNNTGSFDEDDINFPTLEQVELEILLSMKVEDGLSFEKAVQSAMVCTGNEFLFFFPTERFPLPCSAVACVRLIDGHQTASSYIYLYQTETGGIIQVAEPSVLDDGFENFASSFVGVMEQLRDLTHVVTN